jgi:mannose-1-phosphate guanylyltransferase
MASYAPAVLKAATEAVAHGVKDLDFIRLDKAAFAESPDISIDYAIMEKTSNAAVVPSPFKWSDLGSWDAIWKSGQAMPGQCRRRQHHARQHPQLARHDAWRPSRRPRHGRHRRRRQRGRRLCRPAAGQPGRRRHRQDAGLQAGHLKLTETHPTSYRPWGGYTSIFNGDRFQVKRIFVTPGKKLSLQKHHHRSEHWIVVKGTAEVTIGENVQMLRENESVYIPLGEVHRLANPGKILLELIEVQTGSYLGEDDIIRIVDEFGRN